MKKHKKKTSAVTVILKVVHIIICAAFAFLLLFAVGSTGKFSLFFPDDTVVVYGESFPRSAEAIVFSGDEVGDVDELIGKLKDFDRLGIVDLGTYSVELGSAERVREQCGGVRIDFRTHVSMYGKNFDTESTEIDLTGDGVGSIAELAAGLPDLPGVSKVVCADSTIPLDEKRSIAEEFPDVEFDMQAIVNVCGVDAKDSTVDLDLKGCAADEGIVERLADLPLLASVDLHGVKLSPELQFELLDAYPDVDFGWDVEIAGEIYDSDVGDLDLSGRRGIDLDSVRRAIPLFCGLKRIDLSDCGFANETLADFRGEYPDIKIVWRLYMGKWSLKTDAVAFSVLIYAYNYKRLTSADIEVLKYCTDLQALDLGHQALTDLSVIGDYLPDLRILILADNTVSDLRPIAKLKHLHYLELFVNPFLSDLSPIAECKEMVDLNISHLYTVSDISMLYDFPILERLWIEHTAVPQADIWRLRETYPNATVIDQGYGSVDQGWRSHARYFAMIDMYFDTTYISEEFSKYDQADQDAVAAG